MVRMTLVGRELTALAVHWTITHPGHHPSTNWRTLESHRTPNRPPKLLIKSRAKGIEYYSFSTTGIGGEGGDMEDGGSL